MSHTLWSSAVEQGTGYGLHMFCTFYEVAVIAFKPLPAGGAARKPLQSFLLSTLSNYSRSYGRHFCGVVESTHQSRRLPFSPHMRDRAPFFPRQPPTPDLSRSLSFVSFCTLTPHIILL